MQGINSEQEYRNTCNFIFIDFQVASTINK